MPVFLSILPTLGEGYRAHNITVNSALQATTEQAMGYLQGLLCGGAAPLSSATVDGKEGISQHKLLAFFGFAKLIEENL